MFWRAVPSAAIPRAERVAWWIKSLVAYRALAVPHALVGAIHLWPRPLRSIRLTLRVPISAIRPPLAFSLGVMRVAVRVSVALSLSAVARVAMRAALTIALWLVWAARVTMRGPAACPGSALSSSAERILSARVDEGTLAASKWTLVPTGLRPGT